MNENESDAEREAEFMKAFASQVARNDASCQAQGKTAKELRDGRGSGNIEGGFRSCNASGVHRQSNDAEGNRR
jgi:hypothetical protein